MKDHYKRNHEYIKEKKNKQNEEKRRKRNESNCQLYSPVNDTNTNMHIFSASTNCTNSSKPNSNSNSKSNGNDSDACDNELPESVNPETLKDFLNELKESFARSNRSTNRAGHYDDNWQKSNICVICDCLIIGIEEIKLLNNRGVHPRIFMSLKKVCPSHPRSHEFGKVSFIDGRSQRRPHRSN